MKKRIEYTLDEKIQYYEQKHAGIERRLQYLRWLQTQEMNKTMKQVGRSRLQKIQNKKGA